MTDQYYANEDKPVESSENALANYQAQSNAVANFVPQSAQDLNNIGAALGGAYDAAIAAGKPEVAESINVAWETIQQHVNYIAQLDASREAAMAVIKMIDADKQKAEKNYDELNSAVENLDSDDPRIASLIEEIEMDIYDNTEMVDPDWAYDMAWENVHDLVQMSTRLSWQRVHHFVSFLRGYREITDEQRALMVTFIQSFNADMGEVELPVEGDEDDDE